MFFSGSLLRACWSVGRLRMSHSTVKAQIIERILSFGPITVADYMKESLVNPYSGYYMHSKVFGSEGDFITSPEVSQMFGELVGLWFVNQWKQLNEPVELSFVELGPGRGTLLTDVLRAFASFPPAYKSLRVHLVEISPRLRSVQEDNLRKLPAIINRPLPAVSWHDSLADVPHDLPTFILANEFFDALPVHQFQKSGSEWREILVNVTSVDKDGDDKSCDLCFMRASRPTITQTAYFKFAGNVNNVDFVEICPQALVQISEICQRISQNSGAALLIDYGHMGEKGNTLRGFQKHNVCDPLSDPGNIDLTCDVNFAILRERAIASGLPVNVHGPVDQAYFLINMGLLTRLKVLASSCESKSSLDELMSACEMLITKEKMGERFKFMSIVSATPDNLIPPGFIDLPGTPYANQSDG